MNRSRTFILLLLFIPLSLSAQDTIQMIELYDENDLAYKHSDDQRFTGIAQLKRKNGHLIYEETFKDGVILSSVQYYSGKEKKICYYTIYSKNKPYAEEKQYYYGKSKDWTEITSFDATGKKILEEEYEGEKLTYSCEYSGRKKHGQELCYDDDGNQLIFQYVNGKKVKDKKDKK